MTDQGGQALEECLAEDDALIRELNRKIENINKYNLQVQQLEFDGSNLASWRTKTARAIFVMTNILKYWDTKRPSKDSQIELAIDKCASQMIYTTIHPNLCDMIDECDYAHDAMEMLEGHF
ncbi:hypothetical protein CROQUDRAFT_44763 [Cronartium quercuum f. sp. fusiforme G11]|uniref:Uncharacterized protein n=1 Tax=Cronartium quercuum f. sp. fusiforme G11 TaxID=708437 RepID=A0A9P6NHN0_9BASI|nr:hypothetical protein CROQUDRAFT_44763 [Cronartium quercuum f. sp. fusiforme G11]